MDEERDEFDADEPEIVIEQGTLPGDDPSWAVKDPLPADPE